MKKHLNSSSSWTPQVQKKPSPFAPRPFTNEQSQNAQAPQSPAQVGARWDLTTMYGQESTHSEASPSEPDQSLLSPETDESQQLGTGWDLTKMSWHKSSPNAYSGIPDRPLQAKLTVGAADDPYEREADRVAAQVVDQIHSTGADQPLLQSPEQISRTPEVQRSLLDGGEASSDLESAINRSRGSGQSLDAGLQESMGQAMGADFSQVRVHTGAQADALNQSIQAKAFTTGQDVFFRQGEYQPGSRSGQELIAHELTHVVQQSGGVQRLHQAEFTATKTTQQFDQQENRTHLPDPLNADLEPKPDSLGTSALSDRLDKQTPVNNEANIEIGKSDQSVIQRLIVTNDINTNDFIILASIGSYLEHYGDQKVEATKSAQFKSLPPGEPVFIVGHGQAGSVEGMDAAKLFEYLVTLGSLPKHCPFVFIAACQSGTMSTSGKSLAKELGELLHKNGYDKTATVGFDGETAITDIFTGVERVTDPKKYDSNKEDQLIQEMNKNAGDILNNIISKQKGDIKDKANFAVNHRDIRIFYRKLLQEDFFVKGTGMEFTPPPELIKFGKSFSKSKKAVFASWLDLSPNKDKYFSLMIKGKVDVPFDLDKYGWAGLEEMIAELTKYEKNYRANTSLAMMYGWGNQKALEEAMKDEKSKESEVEPETVSHFHFYT